MTSLGSGENKLTEAHTETSSSANTDGGRCSTYTFPEGRSPDIKGHGRSVSHGGATSFSSAGSVGRPSAIKSTRGHQRAFSQGQISEPGTSKPGHSRVGSKTEFLLPPGHKEPDPTTSIAKTSAKGHSRQASRSESIYTLRQSSPPSLWRRFLCFILRQSPRTEQEERFRTVVPNHTISPKTPRKEHPNGRRPNNKIRTTKYTLLSFLPRNLLEQFHRVANLYFIFIVLLNWFPAINAFGKEIAMVPVIFVLGVTAVKDLFEDRRRHASDKRINNSTCRIYNSEIGRYKKVLWKEVRVGDIIHLSNNETVPADILLLRSSDPSGICYIDTGHLDGETNLKQRQVVRGFLEKAVNIAQEYLAIDVMLKIISAIRRFNAWYLQKSFEPSKFRSAIEVDAPTTKIYSFKGALIHSPVKKVPVGTDNLLLRECVLKNTDYIEGIVVYAGDETKAMLNNGGPRYKRSALERQMNQDVIWCVIMLIVLCVIGATGCKIWLDSYPNLMAPFKPVTYSESSEAFLAFWTYIIILQIMIPLSLYVTLEMCKIIQVYYIHNNADLYDSVMDKRTECRALNITEELGQIQYIFSDKTGTLTENRMIFRHCCIAGVDYNHPTLEDDSKSTKSSSLSVVVNPTLKDDLNFIGGIEQNLTSRQIHAARIHEFLFLLAVCNTVVCSNRPHHDIMNDSGIIEPVVSLYENNDRKMDDIGNTSDSSERYSRLAESRSITPSPPQTNKSRIFNNKNNHVPSLTPITSTESSPITENAPAICTKISFKPNKLLNISSLPFLGNKHNGSSSNLQDDPEEKLDNTKSSPFQVKPIYEAESPDELALVDAAYSYNIKLLQRTPNSVIVDVPIDGNLEYEILNTLPFDSVRKCMSVIIRNSTTKQITIYTKGADSVVLTKLAQVKSDSEEHELIMKTQQMLFNYAKDGLRVLVMAKRILTQAEYNDWSRKHKELEANDEGADKIQKSYDSIESNLTLLGSTGIEDRLQEGVPETLSSLINAGIVVWVLTGDKPETAINISYSAKLFSPQMELLKLMNCSRLLAEEKINFYLDEIERQSTTPNGNYRNTTTEEITSNNSTTVPTRFESRVASSLTRNTLRALIIDSTTLTVILDRKSNLVKKFLKLTTFCRSVLCCRATPLQKAYIVRVVKEELKMRTLAIGDGANDVSMIQTADVGIGISGQEGLQAVMAADFALSRFQYLERFLLVHGHWSYDRLSNMVLYFFYKNAAFVFLIFWYQLYCGFSGAVMIDQMYLMLYNLLFTSLPPLAIGVYDQDAPEEVLREHPFLYRRGRLGKVYRSYSFALTMFDALYQSIAIFFICQGAYSGSDVDIWEFGTVLTTSSMFVMLLHAAIEIRSWTIIHVISIVFSIGAFYTYSLLYNSLCVNCFGLPSNYWIIQHAMGTLNYWLVIPLCCVVALLPRLTIRVAKTVFCPDEVTRTLLATRRNNRRGEGFLVSWSRSTSASSIYRTTDYRNQNHTLTAVG